MTSTLPTALGLRCGDLGHPGATFNPWLNKTWCTCGAVVRDGDHSSHVACCGGPLDKTAHPELRES